MQDVPGGRKHERLRVKNRIYLVNDSHYPYEVDAVLRTAGVLEKMIDEP